MSRSYTYIPGYIPPPDLREHVQAASARLAAATEALFTRFQESSEGPSREDIVLLNHVLYAHTLLIKLAKQTGEEHA